METLNAKRTTKYGIQLEDGSFRYTTDAVKTFLEGKLPAQIEVLENQANKISKVNVSFSTDRPAAKSFSAENRVNVDAGNILQRSIELIVASNGNINSSAAVNSCLRSFFYAMECLKAGEVLEEQEEPTA